MFVLHRSPPVFPLAILLGTAVLGASVLAAAGLNSTAIKTKLLVEVSAEVGLDFVHFNGMTGQLYFPEMAGAGAAWLDYDGDGDLDLYLIDGRVLQPGKKPAEAVFPYGGKGVPRDRLYRNDLQVLPSGEHRVQLVEVTDQSGLRATGYGMGIATGDFDNDGHVDIYLANFGPNQLWHNRGDGTFEDWTAKSSTDDPHWSATASWIDFDRDGWLDLLVVNYVTFTVDNNLECYADSSRRDYCGPAAYPPVADRLLRNRGDGTFEDVSLISHIGRTAGAGLGVVAADLNGDRWIDLYVANDGQPNQLWINRQNGTFEDDALFAGVAVNRKGQPEASMGVDAADLDNDGDLDLFMTHLMGETNTLYINDGGALFEDRTTESGLAASGLPLTSFGTAFFDLDNDGHLDLWIASGAVRLLEPLARAGDVYPLDQSNQLLHNRGDGRFENWSARAGAALEPVEVSRGTAFGDFDNDGDTDLLVSNNSGPARLLRNDAANGQPWLGLRLLDRNGRDALGARVEVRRVGAGSLWRRVATDGSYASANDPRILAGLGGGDKLSGLRVNWPDGQQEDFPAPPMGRYTTLHQGGGKKVE